MYWTYRILADLEEELAFALRREQTASVVAREIMERYGVFVKVQLKDLGVEELTAALKKHDFGRSVLCTPPGQAFLADLHTELTVLCR